MGLHQADASDNLKDFLKKVDVIESLIAKLTNLLNKLQTANEESKAVTKASAMKGEYLFILAHLTLFDLKCICTLLEIPLHLDAAILFNSNQAADGERY